MVAKKMLFLQLSREFKGKADLLKSQKLNIVIFYHISK